MTFYAVRFGRIPGIYTSWNECKKQVTGFKGAIYKKFSNESSAEIFCKNTSKTYKEKSTKEKTKDKIIDRTKDKTKEKTKDKDTLYIFTDGSSINNGSKNANSGFGIYIPEPENAQVKISAKLPKGKQIIMRN